MTGYTEKLKKFRNIMVNNNINYYLTKTSDSHDSEYIDAHYMSVKYLSGFSGSNGVLIIGLESAWLFTDGRYFIQAEDELKGSGIELMKMGESGVPSVSEHLDNIIKLDDVLGADGDCINFEDGLRYIDICNKNRATFKYDCSIIDELWTDRPTRKSKKVTAQKGNYSGLDVKKKIKQLRKRLKEDSCDAIFLSKLDEIMWLFNIRGQDVECNPVAFSYAYIDKANAFLFLQKKAVGKNLKEYASDNGFQILDYDKVLDILISYAAKKKIRKPKALLLDKSQTSIRFGMLIKSIAKECKYKSSPVLYLKSVKNSVEQNNIRDFYLKDSLALVKFLYWFDESLKKGEQYSELQLSEKLQKYRKKIDGYIEDSFPAIVAYKENAAMAHYEPKEGQSAIVNKRGFLLIDSGGQYKGATTDSTRTIVCGELTDKEVRCFTLVLKGFLRLMDARFLEGCTGHNLDILARGALWKNGLDYRHGTGHGVGYCLNVHEGPQSIRWRLSSNEKDCVLKAGMLVTDEPGYYEEGEFGIRTENTLLVVKDIKSEYGQFLKFENLIFAPIDRRAICVELLDFEEVIILNNYHKEVYKKLSGHLKNKEKKWLEKMCRPI